MKSDLNILKKNSIPISEALNLAASATSLREDIAACEQIMTERHHFLVSMLDGMDRKVSIIGGKFKDLEQRVNKLEKMNTLIGQQPQV